MQQKTNWYRWFIAGSMLGALGVTMMNNYEATPNMKKMRRNVSGMTKKMAREAGDSITSFGESLAKNIH